MTDKLVVGTISSPLSALSDAVGSLASQLQQNQANRVQTFTVYAQGKAKEKIGDAQYIEDLRPNQDRLNLFSSMPRGDNGDYYKFNLNFSGNVHFGMITDLLDDNGNTAQSGVKGAADIEILQMHGDTPTVVASSDPTSGDNYSNYQALMGGGMNLQAGQYTIHVTRDASVSNDNNYFYSFQLAGDRYYQDFDTIQSPASQKPGESVMQFLQPDPVTGLLAGSVDATSELAGMSSIPVNGASLSAGAGDGTNPAVRLLSAFA